MATTKNTDGTLSLPYPLLAMLLTVFLGGLGQAVYLVTSIGEIKKDLTFIKDNAAATDKRTEEKLKELETWNGIQNREIIELRVKIEYLEKNKK